MTAGPGTGALGTKCPGVRRSTPWGASPASGAHTRAHCRRGWQGRWRGCRATQAHGARCSRVSRNLPVPESPVSWESWGCFAERVWLPRGAARCRCSDVREHSGQPGTRPGHPRISHGFLARLQAAVGRAAALSSRGRVPVRGQCGDRLLMPSRQVPSFFFFFFLSSQFLHLGEFVSALGKRTLCLWRIFPRELSTPAQDAGAAPAPLRPPRCQRRGCCHECFVSASVRATLFFFEGAFFTKSHCFVMI